MSLQTTDYPSYNWNGFSIWIMTAETRSGRFRAFWNVNKCVGGDSGPAEGHETEMEAHVAAMARAKEKIEYMLSRMRLEQWRDLGML